jgi:hypothetical protein
MTSLTINLTHSRSHRPLTMQFELTQGGYYYPGDL